MENELQLLTDRKEFTRKCENIFFLLVAEQIFKNGFIRRNMALRKYLIKFCFHFLPLLRL